MRHLEAGEHLRVKKKSYPNPGRSAKRSPGEKNGTTGGFEGSWFCLRAATEQDFHCEMQTCWRATWRLLGKSVGPHTTWTATAAKNLPFCMNKNRIYFGFCLVAKRPTQSAGARDAII